MATSSIDCLVVGGGPAGLTAAIYLARFHLRVRVIDAGGGRAVSIPKTHNHAGFPDGIAGAELVARMREQALKFGAVVTDGRVEALARDGGDFRAKAGDEVLTARTVLLATGVTNHRPPMDDQAHDAAVARGLLRYCPVCDGFEVTDRTIGVIGTAGHGMEEAEFLRSYSRDVTLISPDSEHDLSSKQRHKLSELGIRCLDGPCGKLQIDGDRILVPTPDGEESFDTVYPALGSVIHSRLAVALGAATGDGGCLSVDDNQRTTVEWLYAAGDVVLGLDQISRAMGDAGVASTEIRNQLAEEAPLLR